jgi:hypothetical protein
MRPKPSEPSIPRGPKGRAAAARNGTRCTLRNLQRERLGKALRKLEKEERQTTIRAELGRIAFSTDDVQPLFERGRAGAG